MIVVPMIDQVTRAHSHGARFVHDGLVEEVSAPRPGGLTFDALLEVLGEIIHDGVAVGEVDADGLEVQGMVRQREPPCGSYQLS